MIVIRPATEADLPVILAIYNDAVAHTSAIWTETLVDLENRRAWVRERQGRGFPVLVADEGKGAAGYGTFAEFHPRDGYRLTVEHSIYVAEDARGRGLGKALLAALIEQARRLDKRVMIGAIDATNEMSLGLHRKFGFVEAGRLPGVGVKFGRPLDLVLMQKAL